MHKKPSKDLSMLVQEIVEMQMEKIMMPIPLHTSIIAYQKYAIIYNFYAWFWDFISENWKFPNHSLVGNEADILPTLKKPNQNAQVALLYMWWNGLGDGLLIYFIVWFINAAFYSQVDWKNVKTTKNNCKRSCIFVHKIATLLVHSVQQNVIALTKNTNFSQFNCWHQGWSNDNSLPIKPYQTYLISNWSLLTQLSGSYGVG